MDGIVYGQRIGRRRLTRFVKNRMLWLIHRNSLFLGPKPNSLRPIEEKITEKMTSN